MKVLRVNTISTIENCGECYWAVDDGTCEKTGTKIEDYWKGVLPDCPLENVEDD